MSFLFGDGFDCYSAITDCATFWDAPLGATASLTLSGTGRFAGSRGISGSGTVSASSSYLVKTSGANDAVHHFSLAIQLSSLTGSGIGAWIRLNDSATPQCSIVFRTDGALLLNSGAPTGATLATYAAAVTAPNTWYQFEIEVVISNTVGSIAVRRNGNASNDFFLGSLNTRGGTTNNYANGIGLGSNYSGSGFVIDDLLWRSDAAAVPWVGDVRCFTRMPASDVQAQWTPSTGTSNSGCVDEAQQNAATDYVFSSTVGQSDLYGIAAIGNTPSSIVAVTTRAYTQKSDAGTRNAAVQLKSGATMVQGPSTVLSSSGWGWLSRTDTTDPNGGGPLTATAVNNMQIGCVVTA